MSNEELAELAKSGKQTYIFELWEQNKRLLFQFAYKYYAKYNGRFNACGITLDDLKQECFIIMLNMVEAYQPEKGYKFNTYANYQFKRHIRELLKIGSNYAEEPLNVCNSLSEPVQGQDEDITLESIVKDDTAELDYYNADKLIYQSQLHTELDKAMSIALNPEQFTVISERYYNSRTLKETGELMGITIGQARTLELNGLDKLRRYNNVTKRLDRLRDETISEKAYHATGLLSFRNNQASSVEITVEYLHRNNI